MFNDNSEKVFICSLLPPHLPLSHSSSRHRFWGMVIYLIVVILMKPVLRESKAEYQRIVLVCEGQSDWNRWILWLRFLLQPAAYGCRCSLCWCDALHLLLLGWSSQWEVNFMIKTMTESAVSMTCVWARPNSRFLCFSEKGECIANNLELGRYWSCSLGCLLRAEFAHCERWECESAVPPARGRLVYCLWAWGCAQ